MCTRDPCNISQTNKKRHRVKKVHSFIASLNLLKMGKMTTSLLHLRFNARTHGPAIFVYFLGSLSLCATLNRPSQQHQRRRRVVSHLQESSCCMYPNVLRSFTFCRQSFRTLTRISRYTFFPKNVSRSARASEPTSLSLPPTCVHVRVYGYGVDVVGLGEHSVRVYK
jgi:hypothetical protein